MAGRIIYDPEGLWEPAWPEWLDGEPNPFAPEQAPPLNRKVR